MTLKPGITVVIRSIPPRIRELARAVESVRAQYYGPVPVVVQTDYAHAGAAATGNDGVARVETEWTAFLDDDDEFKPEHLSLCLRFAQQTGADMVYPWFDQPEKNWDGLGGFGIPFHQMAHELEHRNWIPVTVLVKTQLFRSVGGFQYPPGQTECEDWGAWRAMYAAGATIVHLPRRTWIWHHWNMPDGTVGNTSGRADRW